MKDLIDTAKYDEQQDAVDATLESYPKAIIEGASNTFCLYCFSVELDVDEEEWILFLMRNRYAIYSSVYQKMLKENPKRVEELRRDNIIY